MILKRSSSAQTFRCRSFCECLYYAGVPEGNADDAHSYMAVHQKEHLDRILELFKEIGEEVGVLDTEDESPAVDAE